MFKHFLLLASLVFLTFLHLPAQGFLHTSGKAIVNGNGDTVILRGMGLGGWMLQEGYMLQTAEFASAQYQIRDKIEQLIGEADTDAFYDAWLANHVRKIDIDSLKAWGFNSVRLPMHYNLYTLPIEDEPVPGQQTWLSKGFDLTDSLISWCKQNQMYVVLDLHAAPGGQGQDQGISDYDPTKPALWESQANKDKTVALWKRLAERYVDEPWVAGYDLLNETNWNMGGNGPLRSLYGEITDSIRAVDTNHIIFIEGNWFANDFTGLTPPWDNNMVYSPHKYWSYNDKASIQWVLTMRDQYNIPLYFGESGENSNTWFRDAIHLIESHGIGWAWWPMKKIESISGPLSVIKTADYETLLNYWKGSGSTPNSFFARAALMEVTENLKLENCVFQKDVIDAMIRQVRSDESIPFQTHNIPGIIYAPDFDMGLNGSAYFDTDVANYHVSSGSFTAWNNGWIYRNDGVDIEASSDPNSNGFNVGWTAEGEWMQYDIEVANSAVYEIRARLATNGFDGSFHFSADGADITSRRYVPNTGGWQSWQDIIIQDVVLTPEDKKLRFHSDGRDVNISRFEFIEGAATTTIVTDFVSSSTATPKKIQLHLNKPIAGPLPSAPADFQIQISGQILTITDVILDSANPRTVLFTLDETLTSDDVIKISYSGAQIDATDGTTLNNFALKAVENTLPVVHSIPGKVEAEDFITQSGVQLETTSDAGGGQNIGFLDPGDYLDYLINVSQTGTYELGIRTAAESETGTLDIQLIGDNGNISNLGSASFAPTGGWQTWSTTSQTVHLPAGLQTLRMAITGSQFNVNWFDFTFLTSVDDPRQLQQLRVFPNPGTGLFQLEGTVDQPQDIEIQVYSSLGQIVLSDQIRAGGTFQSTLDLSQVPNGAYFVRLQPQQGRVQSLQILKLE
ncbi:MAG: carbohydrate-binding protein [Bacteroidota bacterium]